MPEDLSFYEDVRLLRSQAERCREILAKLKTLGEDSDSPLTRLSVRTLLEEVVEPHRGAGVDIDVIAEGPAEDQPILFRNPAIHYGLGNLVENAVDFARSEVEISAKWDAERLVLRIADDGPGFPDDVLDRIGDPFVSRRGHNARGGGLGLGIFIAKTLLERTGATVAFRREAGASVFVTWPRTVISGTQDVTTSRSRERESINFPP
jgi:two-component system sensor histidine kinase RegB